MVSSICSELSVFPGSLYTWSVCDFENWEEELHRDPLLNVTHWYLLFVPSMITLLCYYSHLHQHCQPRIVTSIWSLSLLQFYRTFVFVIFGCKLLGVLTVVIKFTVILTKYIIVHVIILPTVFVRHYIWLHFVHFRVSLSKSTISPRTKDLSCLIFTFFWTFFQLKSVFVKY